MPDCTANRERRCRLVPGNARVVRDIRANMERTTLPEGLDHYRPDVRAAAGRRPGPWAGKGIDAMD